MADTTNTDTPTDRDEMRGVLFPNNKGDNSNRPDYRGKVQIDGKVYRLSGWARRSKANNRYMSLAVTPEEAFSASTEETNTEEIPF